MPRETRQTSPASGSRRRARAVAIAVAFAFAWGRAEADTTPPPLRAPVPVSAPPVPYPVGGQGREATVLLELLVDTDGRVAEIKVVDGVEPFTSAARAAAATWTYEPARRGDRDVRARIRVRVEFRPPTAQPEEPGAASAAATEEERADPKSAPVPIEEVRVQGARQEVGKTSLGGGEIRQLPGAFGDAFRAIEVLPGVTPIVSGAPYFFVRGAPPGNTGYFIDGVRVPLLFHFGVAQSIIHPGLVDHVDFWAGGYPTRFGRFTGGIIHGETRAPAHKKGVHGEYNARLLDTGVLLEAPVGKDSEVLAAGRIGYPGLLLRVFAPEARLDYWDYQLRASTALDAENRLSVFSFGSHDFIGTVDSDTGETEGTTIRFHRVDVRWDHQVSRDTRMRVATTVGFDETSLEDSGVRDRLAGARVQWESRRSATLTVRGGADAIFDRYDVLSRDAPSGEVGDIGSIPSRSEVTAGVWADAVWKVTPRYELVPGVRLDYFANDGDAPGRRARAGSAWSADPRIASRLRVTDELTYVATGGLAHQPPSLPGTIPGFQPGQLRGGLQTAVQLGQGVEVGLPLELTFAPTLFVSNYLNMTDALTTCDAGYGSTEGCVNRRVRGRAYGLEVMLRRPLTKRLSGLVSYTLSRSTRLARDITGARIAGEIPGEFDRTHVLNLIGAADLGKGWRAGLRFFYYTGRPYSNQINGISIPPYNSLRFPSFYRLDWRLEKRWTFKEGHASLVFEWLNTLLRKEAISLDCESRTGQLVDRCEPEPIGPITVPSIGVEGAF